MAEGEQHVHGKEEAFSPFSIMANNSIIDFCRTSLASMAGISAGILGLTALKGFIFYFIASFFMSILICLKAGTQWRKFFLLLVGSEYIWNLWRNIYIPIILDVFVWDGSCLLTGASSRRSIQHGGERVTVLAIQLKCKMMKRKNHFTMKA
ncbi:ER membrane complex subunit 6 [Desmophyllum pertusum]|uniref:ER membrane protein complex subunit 6 n=1 Tax=Desmophyllum pertusum TaxID=174260 RepID=A0A9W9ZN75_9CNID|nr:ER membrane complex subunit 6 [Desmophyllum pertusum]